MTPLLLQDAGVSRRIYRITAHSLSLLRFPSASERNTIYTCRSFLNRPPPSSPPPPLRPPPLAPSLFPFCCRHRTEGHLDQMSIAKLLSLSSTESEQLSDTFSSVASGCCGGAVAAMAAANNQSKEAIDRQLCAALAAEGSASRDYQREQGAGQQQQHHQRHQQQSEERPVSPSLRPPAAMSNRTVRRVCSGQKYRSRRLSSFPFMCGT